MTTPTRRARLGRLAVTLAALALATAGMFLVRERLDKAHVALIYLLVVLGGSAWGGRAIGVLTGGLAFLIFNFVFLPPYYTLAVTNPLDWLVLLAFLVTSVVAAELLDRQRRQADLAEARALELDRSEALRRADRLKDALLAAVSHDLRTPLTTIKGIAHEIVQRGEADAVIIEEEVDRLTSLVEGLLELSQLDAGAIAVHAELNTVDDLIGAALQRARAVLGARDVQVNLGDDPLLVGRFDFSQSLRVLVNLLENAAKYSPADAAIVVMAQREHSELLIRVADRGPGIPDEERERIFQPFYRVPGAQADVRGAGLGLSIARGLARAQGGELAVAPNPGGGSVFTLQLPAAELPVA